MQGASRQSLAEVKQLLIDTVAASGAQGLGSELFSVLHLLDDNVPLRRALSDGTAATSAKTALTRNLVGSRVGATTLQVLDEVVVRRWSRSMDLADAVEELAVIAEADNAERAGVLSDLEDELFRFGRIVAGAPQLRSALTDRSAPLRNRAALVQRLLATKVTPAALQLISEVVLYPRQRTVEHGLEEYSRLTAQLRRQVVALVRTARPLTDAQRDRLVRALEVRYGREVHMNVEIDPDLLGGLSVQMGDELIDGTISRHLDEASRRLSA